MIWLKIIDERWDWRLDSNWKILDNGVYGERIRKNRNHEKFFVPLTSIVYILNDGRSEEEVFAVPVKDNAESEE